MAFKNRHSQTDDGSLCQNGHSPATIMGSLEPQARRTTLRHQRPKMAETWSEMVRAWPYSTFLIVLNEFCQKFASLSTILPLYMLNVLKFSTGQTTIAMQCYQILGGISPLFGSSVADGSIGKFRTILYGCIIYGVGKVVMSAAAFMRSGSAFHPWLDIVGILIIIVGMGGIIPCVASFGGDQFEPHQERMISVFFSIFYASINSGALFSTIMMPLLRSQPCLDQDSCYPLSFGVSAIFMVVAAVIFVIGSRWYKKAPPKGNVFADVHTAIRIARINKRYSSVERPHWLYYYLDTHDCQLNQKCLRLKKRKKDPNACERAKFLEDIRALFRILVMYLPLPMFWALYDQQYSVWLIQAIQMDCRLWGDWLLLPDMMQFVNPVLILVFIFLFESIIYPIASRFVKLTPLRKMVAGGILASLAFFVSAQVQTKINPTLPEMPQKGHAFVSFMNTFDHCNITVDYPGDPAHLSRHIPANHSLVNNQLIDKNELFRVPLGDNIAWNVAYEGADCEDMNLPKIVQFRLPEERIYFIALGPNGAFLGATNPAKPTGGTGEFSVALNVAFTDGSSYAQNFALCRTTTATSEYACNPQQPENFYFWEVDYDDGKSSDFNASVPFQYGIPRENAPNASLYNYKWVRPGKWRLFYMDDATPKNVGHQTWSKEKLKPSLRDTGIQLEVENQGGVYALVLTGNSRAPQKRVFQVVPSNTVSILWQVPQLAIITAAEILFSITGYEFSYSQSGASMKSIMQALWFLTVAVGDFIIIVVTLLEFPDMALQFNIYAVVMLVVIFIFALMAIFYYEYRVSEDNDGDEEDDDFEEEFGEGKHPKQLANGDAEHGDFVLKQRGKAAENLGFQNDGDGRF